ncbi:MAG: fumarylacetoacetate hydrolase family protein, partial [Ferruginibacter sp.]
MKLVTYIKEERDHLAMLVNGKLYDMDVLHPDLPVSMAMFLNYWDDVMPLARAVEQRIKDGLVRNVMAVSFDDAEIMAPVPHPTSCRDGYAFRQHVTAARRNRKVEMIPEFDQFPILYFTNHNSIQG